MTVKAHNIFTRVLLLHGISSARESKTAPYDFLSGDQLSSLARYARDDARTEESIEFSFDDGHKSVLRAVEVIRRISPHTPIHIFLPSEIFEFGLSSKLLSLADVRSLANDRNIFFGSHGHHHFPLTKLTELVVKRDLERSRFLLKEVVGREIFSISYPFGEVNSPVRRAVVSAGFSVGYSSFFGINTAETNPLMLNRIQILGTDGETELRGKLSRRFFLRGYLQRIRYFRRLL
jgi:peptidoglycan/xylan/chitin deacetylase (PgdA/CDA1 family)